jgi:hypothetical protein
VKKDYVRPVLVTYGRVEILTRGSGGFSPDTSISTFQMVNDDCTPGVDIGPDGKTCHVS